MDFQEEIGKTNIEEQLRKKSKEKKNKIKKITKTSFIVNLYNGKPGREGDECPFEPIRDPIEIAKKLEEAEKKGYFKVRLGIKLERNEKKYISEAKWYLTQAAKNKLIDREYHPRKKVKNQS